jgi:hypothetical protein
MITIIVLTVKNSSKKNVTIAGRWLMYPGGDVPIVNNNFKYKNSDFKGEVQDEEVVSKIY